MRGPTFICPGAQKSGTTWLNAQLKLHPEFRMPPQKEVDYLDRYESSRRKYAQRFKNNREKLERSADRLAWWEFFTSDWDIQKYPELFAFAGDKMTGDVSPNYSLLSQEAIDRAATLVPEARIILLFRDPVDRAWSHARHHTKHMAEGRGIEDPMSPEDSLAETVAFAQSNRCVRYTRYTKMLRHWQGAFGADQVFVGYYDDLVERPETLLNNILSFLDAGPVGGAQKEALSRIVNKGESAACPPELRATLTDLFAPEVKRLRQRVPAGELPQWLNGKVAG